MDSKTSFSFHWRMFMPLALTLWLALTLIIMIQYQINSMVARDSLRHTLSRVNEYLIRDVETGTDPERTVRFLDSYLKKTHLQDISLAVYDNHTGERLFHSGFDLPAPVGDSIREAEFYHAPTGYNLPIDNNGRQLSLEPNRVFYSQVSLCSNGDRVVQVVMPNNLEVSTYNYVRLNKYFVAATVCVGILATIFCFFFTRHMARNISLLREFAARAARDDNFNELDKFSNDELGDISRQIVHMYSTRTAAVAAREQEHKVALRAVQEKSEVKRQLTNNINHELKTPTTIIKGYIDTILSDPEMPEATRTRFLVKTQVQVERLVQMLNDLSTLTRMEDGSSTIRTEKVDMHELIFTLANDLTESGLLKDITFENDIPFGCKVIGNENSLLNNVFMNLAKNAINYAKCTRMGCKLLSENEKYCTFVFWDNGTGVPPEHLPHLFERFYRVDDGRARKNGGTGLGLPIVKDTITALQGSASMRNGTPHGLECVFTLPRWVDHPQEATDQSTDKTSDQSTQDGKI